MATTVTISQAELKRQAGLVYEGKTLNVMLCSLGSGTLTAESTVAEWQAIEKSGNGYSRFSEELAVGAYDSLEGAYVIPYVLAEFSATGIGYTFDSIVLYIEGEAKIHSLVTESPSVTLAPGQTQSYKIPLAQSR